jgi:ABC-type transport system involved in multi-copper enzyme maturation permease subunit
MNALKLSQYKALIIDTFLKELRSKTLIFIFLATTASIVLGHLILSAMNNDLAANGSAGLSLVGVNILSVNFKILNTISFFIASVFGVSVFRSDFQNNIIYQYLTFPISRTEYFFSRVVGCWALVMSYYLYAYVLSTVLFSLAFKNFVFTTGHLIGFLVLSFYLLLVIFISIFFSLIMNKIGALFSTFACSIIALISYGTYSKIPYAESLSQLSFFKILGIIFYFLYPRISFLDEVSSSFIMGDKLEINMIEQTLHLLVITFCYVFLANLIIKKKDF